MSKKDAAVPLKELKDYLEFLKLWREISTCQAEIINNYQGVFPGLNFCQQLIQLCPENLQQAINPWKFSLFTVAKEMKGTPELEMKLIKNVASYGSQIGTIIDFIELMEQEYPLDRKKYAESEKMPVICKFEELADKIDKAKKVNS